MAIPKEELLKRFGDGQRAALSKIITMVENHAASFPDVLDELYPRTGKAYRIGVTGPPGAGKSTLVSSLVQTIRGTEKTVGVIAVDPSSPFTGGALLGDRIRMQDIGTDPGSSSGAWPPGAHWEGLPRLPVMWPT